MAKLLKIEQYDNQLVAIFDDGTRTTAVPTMGGLWYATDNYTPPTPPPVDPGGGGGARFQWPFDPRPAPWVSGGVPGGTVTSEYGPRSGGTYSVHEGIDFQPGGTAGAPNTPIPAAGAGRAMLRSNSGFGNHVIIDHGDSLYTIYAHMPNGGFRVGDGAAVAKGQIIGLIGSTGHAFGPHLHFETHVGGMNFNPNVPPGTHMNPRLFMQKYQG